MNYLPIAFPFFFLLAGIVTLLIVLIQVRVLHFIYTRLGLSPVAVIMLLCGSLFGSYVNIPVWSLGEQEVVSGRVIDYYGMRYIVPVVVDWPQTIIAINVGGALIPTMLSLYLLSSRQLWGQGIVATAIVAAACHAIATPVPGLGIAIPGFVPPIVTALAAIIVSRLDAPAVAYISGSLGTLIGADLLNLGKVQGLGAPIVSIGGAGTFDGVFLTGIVAVLLASLWPRR